MVLGNGKILLRETGGGDLDFFFFSFFFFLAMPFLRKYRNFESVPAQPISVKGVKLRS